MELFQDSELESVLGELGNLSNTDYVININKLDDVNIYYNDINGFYIFGDFSFLHYSEYATMHNAFLIIGVHKYTLKEILTNPNWYQPLLDIYFNHRGEYLTMNIFDILINIYQIHINGWIKWVYFKLSIK
jgi:hypothetical protein